MASSAWIGDVAQAKGRFFAVLHTTARTQVATMTVAPGHEAGPPEIHDGEDQIFLILEGRAEVQVWERGAAEPPRRETLGSGGILVVPANMRHHVKSVGPEPLFFFTAYGPPAY